MGFNSSFKGLSVGFISEVVYVQCLHDFLTHFFVSEV